MAGENRERVKAEEMPIKWYDIGRKEKKNEESDTIKLLYWYGRSHMDERADCKIKHTKIEQISVTWNYIQF